MYRFEKTGQTIIVAGIYPGGPKAVRALDAHMYIDWDGTGRGLTAIPWSWRQEVTEYLWLVEADPGLKFTASVEAVN